LAIIKATDGNMRCCEDLGDYFPVAERLETGWFLPLRASIREIAGSVGT